MMYGVMLDRYDLEDAVGKTVYDQEVGGRQGIVTTADYIWSTSYCECCGPYLIGTSGWVKWEDGTEEYYSIEDGEWGDDKALYFQHPE